MTIAAGFVCDSGIVLCADTQEQSGYIKTTGQKIFAYQRDWCNAVFAGAGNADLIDSLIEQITERLDEGHDTQKTVIAAMRSAVLDFHQNEVAYYPSDNDDRLIELLVGIKPKNEREMLCKITGPAIKTVPTHAVIGTGTLVRYIAQRLYRDFMPVKHGIFVSVYLLAMAKKYVSGCGESTHIFTLLSDNSMRAEMVLEVMDQEMHISSFEGNTRELMFAVLDEDLDKIQFQNALGLFIARTKEMHERIVEAKPLNEHLKKLRPKGYPFDPKWGGK